MDHDYLKYRELKQDDVLLILGAYDGDFMREKKDEILDKNIYVINIEPDYRTFKICYDFIQKNLPLNATVLPVAVWKESGIISFSNSTVELASSITGIDGICPVLNQSKILGMSLDDILTMYKVTCVFADIEGAELDVFLSTEYFTFRYVDYYAIASYHKRNGEPTWIKLSSYFQKSNFDVTVDLCSEENETILYARRML